MIPFYIRLTVCSSKKCAIPVFEGLLPSPDSEVLLRLLFVTAHCHGLGKLRMHLDQTIEIYRIVTKDLGRSLRYFQKTVCKNYKTRELDREKSARLCRIAKEATARKTVE